MSLEIEKHDRHSRQNDSLSGTLALAPLRISGTLPDGTPFPVIELADGERLVLVVEELGGQREANDHALALAELERAATTEAIRANTRLRDHLAVDHGLAPNEIPDAPAKLHDLLPHPATGHGA